MSQQELQPRCIIIGTDHHDELTSQVLPFKADNLAPEMMTHLAGNYDIYTSRTIDDVEAFAFNLLNQVKEARNPESTYIQENECVEGCGPANHLHGNNYGLEPCCGDHKDCTGAI